MGVNLASTVIIDLNKVTIDFLKYECNVCHRGIPKDYIKSGVLPSNWESTGFVTIATQKGQPEGFQA